MLLGAQMAMLALRYEGCGSLPLDWRERLDRAKATITINTAEDAFSNLHRCGPPSILVCLALM